MSIMLGNLTVEQMERRLGITLTEEHRQMLQESRQEPMNIPLGDDKWHCFDIPFMMMCDTKETAVKFRDIIQQYKIRDGVMFQIGWER